MLHHHDHAGAALQGQSKGPAGDLKAVVSNYEHEAEDEAEDEA
jgi:hypothetical protein